MDITTAAKKISSNIDNSDKVYFNRKLKELEELVDIVNDYAFQIESLEMLKFAKVVELSELRKSIISRCTHPEHRLHKHKDNDNVFTCDFCETDLLIAD